MSASTKAPRELLWRGLKLYRGILRSHGRYLPSSEMRELGDAYVKSEFRLHHKPDLVASNPGQYQTFLSEWEKYLDHVLQTARAIQARDVGSMDDDDDDAGPTSTAAAAAASHDPAVPEEESPPSSKSVFDFGRDLPTDVELSEEQKQQLQKLKEEASKVGSS